METTNLLDGYGYILDNKLNQDSMVEKEKKYDR